MSVVYAAESDPVNNQGLFVDRDQVKIISVSDEAQIDSPAAIAERLRQALKACGMSQNQLEKRSGLSKGYVSRLTRKDGYSSPTSDVINKITNALGISSDWLLQAKGPMIAANSPTQSTPPPVPSPVIEMREIVRERDVGDPYPNRAIVRAKMRGYYDDLSPRSKAAFDGRFRGGDLPEEGWQERLLTLRKVEQLGLMPFDDGEDYVPMKLK